jgi:hypothetical protein
MSEPDIDLAYVGRSLQRLTGEVASLRDDMNVLTAILVRMDSAMGRQDATVAAPLTEIRAMHSQYSRLANRITPLEDK